MIRKIKLVSVLLLALAGIAMTGCQSTITNLTPSTMPRNQTGFYPFEVLFDTNQRSIRENSLQPHVIVGLESYSMQPTPLLNNRWETLIHIPPDQDHLIYRYKFDYRYSAIPETKSSSRLSQPYELRILD